MKFTQRDIEIVLDMIVHKDYLAIKTKVNSLTCHDTNIDTKDYYIREHKRYLDTQEAHLESLNRISHKYSQEDFEKEKYYTRYQMVKMNQKLAHLI